MSYLFVFRTSPDVDHMVPLVWKLLEEGEEVHAVVAPGYDPDKDHRLAFVAGYERFHMHRVSGLRGSLPYALWLLRRVRARIVAVEWGYGLQPGFERPRSLAALHAAARTLVRSVRRREDPKQVRSTYLAAARLLGRATVCLPHGLSIKLDTAANREVQRALANGDLNWGDRNRVDAFVLNTEHHRQFYVDHAEGDPEVMQTWGSLRWSPQWFELNCELAPAWEWPAGSEGRLKLVFMVPKWANRVDAPAVIELVERLHQLPYVSFAIQGHPRTEDGSADVLRDDPAIDWSEIHDVSKINSVSVIREADVVIDVGSSIGLEVVLQGRTLINPTYIHELTTLFDEIPGSCVVAHDADAVVAALELAAAGDPPRPDAGALHELLRRAVYGDRDEPFDVLELYSERFHALASTTTQRS